MFARHKEDGARCRWQLQNALPKSHLAQGISLVEILIVLGIGLIVMSGVISLFTSSIRSSYDGLRIMHLNQDLRTVMTVMTSDIRRAEFWGTAINSLGPTTANDNVFALNAPNAYPGSAFGAPAEAANSCLTYSYDANSNGLADANEAYGFRLRAGGVEIRQNGATCSAHDSWLYLTDEATLAITSLQFTVIASPVTLAPALPGTLWVREVRVVLTGQLISDPTVRRTLIETVRIRNDRYTP